MRANSIYFIAFFLTALICSTPFLGIPLLIVVLLLISLMLLVINTSYLRLNRALFLSVILYSLLIVFYRVADISDAAWGRYAIYLYLNVQILMLPLIRPKFLLQMNNMVLWISLAVMLANVSWNIIIISMNPLFNEKRIYFDEEILNSLNVGSSSFFSFTLMLFIVCFFVYLNCKERIVKRIMLVSSVIISVYIVGFCFKASVVLLWFTSAVLLMYAKKFKNIITLMIIMIGIIILGYYFITSYNNEVVRFIVSNSPSERLTVRLVGLVSPDSIYASTTSFEAREDLWRSSLNTWLANLTNFLFGIGDHWGDIERGIGQHSDFIDSLGKYGLLGGLILFFMFKKAFNYIIGLYDDKYRVQLYIIILIYFACGMTKRVFLPGVNFVIFMLLPLSARFVNERQAMHSNQYSDSGR